LFFETIAMSKPILLEFIAYNVRAWRSAGNSILSAGTIAYFLFKVQDKNFLLSKVSSR
jgi:hypothetical protein